MRVAVAQAASVWPDAGGDDGKVLAMLDQASRQRVELVPFPGAFLSRYPFWVMLGGGGRFGDPDHTRDYAAYIDAGVDLNGPQLREITEAARDRASTASGLRELAA
jgi:nitrilase